MFLHILFCCVSFCCVLILSILSSPSAAVLDGAMSCRDVAGMVCRVVALAWFVAAERLRGVGKGTDDALIDDDMFWEPPPIRVFRITARV